MSEDYKKFNELINSAFENIHYSDMQEADSVVNVWKKVLLRIKSNSNPNEGQNLSDHSRIVDLKNGLLIVEADHPGWINLLQLHKNYILRGIKMELPALTVNNIAFKLKGRKDDIYGSRPSEGQIQKTLEKRFEEEEIQLKKAEKEQNISLNQQKKNQELPPELSGLFEDLKQSMLTNSKK